MLLNQQAKEYIQEYKQQFPEYNEYSDLGVYNYLEGEGHSFPVGVGKASPSYQNKVVEPKTDLNVLEELWDYGIDENSTDWLKSAYNNSLSGITERAITGEDRYKIDYSRYNPNIVEDIMSSVVSLAMPLDLASLWVGGKAGQMAMTPLIKYMQKKAGQEITKAGVQSMVGLSLAQKAIVGAGKQAPTLGVYEAAIGGVQAKADGKDSSEIAKATVDGLIHGSILGAATGGVATGMAGKHAEILTRGLSKKAGGLGRPLTRGENLLTKALGLPAQIGAESGIFTGSELVQMKMNGQDVDGREALTSFARNVGLFSILKAQGKLMQRGAEKYKEYEKEFLVDTEKKANEAEADAFRNVKETVKDYEANDGDVVNPASTDIKAKLTELEQVKRNKAGKLEKSRKEAMDDLQSLYKGIAGNKFQDGNGSHVAGAINKINSSIQVLEEIAGKYKERSKERIDLAEKANDSQKASEIEGIAKELEQMKTDIVEGKGKKTRAQLVEEAKELEIEEVAGEKPGELKKLIDAETSEIEAAISGKQEKIEFKTKQEKDKLTPSGKEEASVDVKTTEKFLETKDDIRYKAKKKQQKEYSKRVEKFAKLDKEVVESTGGFEIDTPQFTKYQQNKNIVRHFIQNVYPTKIGGTGRKGAFLKGAYERAKQLDSFAKWLAKEGKTFSTMENVDFQNYLSQKPTHLTTLQNLREFVQTNQIVNPSKFNLTQSQAKDFAKAFIGESPEGLSIDNKSHKIDKDGLTFVQPKTNQPITKWISGRLKTLLKKIRKDNPNAESSFIDVNGNVLDNKTINVFTDTIFGNKGKKDKARLFRKSMVSWASDKYGINSREKEIIKQEVLGDKANQDVIGKAYDVASMKEFKEKLVKEFISEIKAGGKNISAEGFYNTKDIAKGLKKLPKKDIEINGRAISPQTAEALARYLIEASPRLNEIVPSIQPKIKSKQPKVKLQTEAAGMQEKFKATKDYVEQAEYFKEKYPHLDVQFRKSLGKFQGEAIRGRITGHLIEVAKGKATVDTIPHEVSHHVVSVLEAIGSKKSKALIAEGKRLFKGEEGLVQAIGEYAAGRMKNKSKIARTKEWVKRFWSHLKSVFGIHNKQDVLRIMSDKVLKGKIPKSEQALNMVKSLETKHQLDKDINREAHNLERQLIDGEDVSLKDIDRLRRDVFGEERLQYKPDRKGRPDWSYTTKGERAIPNHLIEHYRDRLNAMTGGKGGIGRRIKEARREFQITETEGKEILEFLGVKEGKVDNVLSWDVVRAFESFAREHGTKSPITETTVDKIGLLNKVNLPALRGIMPVYHVLKKYGGKPGKEIADKILGFDYVQNYMYKGQGDQASFLIKGLLGKKKKHAWLFDKERREKYDKEFGLSPEEKSFVKELKTEGSDVHSAQQVHEKLMNYYWESLYHEAKKHNNKIEFKDFERTFDKKFVNGYMSRRLTKEALESIVENKSLLDKLVNEKTNKAINKLADTYALEKTNNNRNSSKFAEIKENRRIDLKQEKEFNKIRSEIEADIFNILSHKHYKVKNRYLMERSPLLPEFMELPNKKGQIKNIRVYETKVESTIDPYISGMSKYLATLRFFPEWTGIGGKYKIGSSKMHLVESYIKDNALGHYAKKSIERLIGASNPDMLLSSTYKSASKLSTLSASIGLSSPLSGIKNSMIGIPRSIAQFGLGNTLKGLRLAFDPRARAEARRKGALEYGAKTLELGEKRVLGSFTLDKLFKFNLMTQTENINRIASMEAGRLYALEAIGQLRGQGGMFTKKWNKGRTRDLMKEMWRLSEDQINFIEKADFNKGKNIKQYDYILGQIEHYSHVSSQGGTGVGNLPLWASSGLGKPLTLFQRMAGSTTWDSARNYVMPAYKHGNFAPLAKATIAHGLSGMAIYQMYDWLFDSEPPKSAGSDLDKAVMYLNRSEMLGVFGFLVDGMVYNSDRLSNPILEPVVVRNLEVASSNLYSALRGTKTLTQAKDDWLKNAIVVYNQADRFLKKIKSPQYTDAKRLSTLEREFKQQRNISSPVIEIESKRRPYYRKLRDTILFGKASKGLSWEESIAKEYWKGYNYLITELEQQWSEYSPRKRHKLAKQALKSSLNAMNPIDFSEKKEGFPGGLSKKKLFLDWIKDNLGQDTYNMAIKAGDVYGRNRRMVDRIIRESKYKNKYSVYPNL